MPATIIMGGQWGDEGKGKLTDALAGRLDATDDCVVSLGECAHGSRLYTPVYCRCETVSAKMVTNMNS